MERTNISTEKLQQRSALFNNYITPNKSFADILNKNTNSKPVCTLNHTDINKLNDTLSAMSNHLNSLDALLKENTRRINVIYKLVPLNNLLS